MADRGLEHVRLSDQVLGQEATVGGADAPHPLGIGPGMGCQEGLGPLDDLVSSSLAPVVDVAGGEGLAVADGAAGLGHVDRVALAGPDVLGIAASVIHGHRRGSAVVINDDRIGPVGIETARVVDAAVQRLAVRQQAGPHLGRAEVDVPVV